MGVQYSSPQTEGYWLVSWSVEKTKGLDSSQQTPFSVICPLHSISRAQSYV